MKLKLVLAALAASLMAATSAAAGELFAGVYSHDIDDQISHGHYETGPQIVIGAKTAPIDELKFLFKPKVHLLAGISTTGGTDYLAAGFSWRLHMTERFYVEPGIGVAIHDGRINFPSPDEPGITAAERAKRFNDWNTKLDLGSRVTFEPELSIGYKATKRLSAEISWIHLSHAQLAGKQNPGLGDFGVRLLYRYGLDR